MSSITIDREQKRDWMVGYAGLAKGGSVSGVGGLVVMLDNPWYSKVIPIYNQHTATQAEEENQRTTIQLGSIGFCFTDKNKGNLQLGYLNINNGPTYFCPLLDWRHGKEVEGYLFTQSISKRIYFLNDAVFTIRMIGSEEIRKGG